MGEVKVSVIIPVYNLEKYLRECIESVLRQTFTHIEIICIDDHSQDNSFKILTEFQKRDPRLKVYRNDGKGQGAARNLGISKAEGEFVAFVDCDDKLHEEMLEQLYVTAIQNQSDVVMCFPFCFDNGTGKRSEQNYFRHARQYLQAEGGTVIFQTDQTHQLLPHIPVVPWNKIYSRKLLLLSGAKFAEGMMHEDFPFFVQVMANAVSLTVVQKELYFYRVNRKGSLSKNAHHDAFEDVPRVFRHTENLVKQELKEAAFNQSFSLFKAKHIILWANALLISKHVSKSEKEKLFNLLSAELNGLSPFKYLKVIDKVQYVLIKYNLLLPFKFKVSLDNLKSALLNREGKQ